MNSAFMNIGVLKPFNIFFMSFGIAKLFLCLWNTIGLQSKQGQCLDWDPKIYEAIVFTEVKKVLKSYRDRIGVKVFSLQLA